MAADNFQVHAVGPEPAFDHADFTPARNALRIAEPDLHFAAQLCVDSGRVELGLFAQHQFDLNIETNGRLSGSGLCFSFPDQVRAGFHGTLRLRSVDPQQGQEHFSPDGYFFRRSREGQAGRRLHVKFGNVDGLKPIAVQVSFEIRDLKPFEANSCGAVQITRAGNSTERIDGYAVFRQTGVDPDILQRDTGRRQIASRFGQADTAFKERVRRASSHFHVQIEISPALLNQSGKKNAQRALFLHLSHKRTLKVSLFVHDQRKVRSQRQTDFSLQCTEVRHCHVEFAFQIVFLPEPVNGCPAKIDADVAPLSPPVNF